MNRGDDVFLNVGGNPHVHQQAVAPEDLLPKSSKEKYKDVLYSMGVVEIITGSLSIILGIAALVTATFSPYRGIFSESGVWCGVFAIVVGILGVRAKSNSSKCMYNANMALSIIGANVMVVLTILSGIAAGITDSNLPGLIAVYSILTLLGFVGMIIMIIHSAYCCAGVCCKSYQGMFPSVSYYPTTIGMQQPQLIQLADGQYVLAAYPVTQVPVSGGIIPAHIPGDIAAAAPPQTVALVAQQATYTNSQQPSQKAKEYEANSDPPGYSTLPRN